MSATSVETASARRTPLRARLSNPWGRPRFLAITTWVYIFWSLVPVLLAIRFAFNSGRSRTSLQGWSLRWFYEDPTLSVFHDPTLQAALKHSLVLAAIVMVIATPLGTALALGMRRWHGPGAGVANIVLLLPLVTPELVFALSIDDFVVSQYLASGADTTTVPMRIYSQARGGPTPALNALASIMLVVSLLALVLAYFAYRALTRGEERASAVQQLGMDMG